MYPFRNINPWWHVFGGGGQMSLVLSVFTKNTKAGQKEQKDGWRLSCSRPLQGLP